MAFAARDLLAQAGRDRRAYVQRSVRREQRSLRQKEPPPCGLRRVWPVALLLAGMRPPRASPQGKPGGTNVTVFVRLRNWAEGRSTSEVLVQIRLRDRFRDRSIDKERGHR